VRAADGGCEKADSALKNMGLRKPPSL